MSFRWKKKGVIFQPEMSSWMHSHAQMPFVGKVDEERIEIIFSTRDKRGFTYTASVHVDKNDISKIKHIAERPLLSPGKPGAFDDSGAMPCWMVKHGDEEWLYYQGWNRCVDVPYRNAIGIAIRQQDGCFKRMFDGPVMDRTTKEPFYCGVPSVYRDGDIWRMWYMSCTEWQDIDGKQEPRYHIKYAESNDGINWKRDGRVAIDYIDEEEGGIVRAHIHFIDGKYHMWYSRRKTRGYREDKAASYRIGYATSLDGMDWTRNDDKVNIDVSTTGWDAGMMAYPYVFDYKSHYVMLYCGNSFGLEGFGYAESWAE